MFISNGENWQVLNGFSKKLRWRVLNRVKFWKHYLLKILFSVFQESFKKLRNCFSSSFQQFHEYTILNALVLKLSVTKKYFSCSIFMFGFKAASFWGREERMAVRSGGGGMGMMTDVQGRYFPQFLFLEWTWDEQNQSWFQSVSCTLVTVHDIFTYCNSVFLKIYVFHTIGPPSASQLLSAFANSGLRDLCSVTQTSWHPKAPISKLLWQLAPRQVLQWESVAERKGKAESLSCF